ncbi:hypothetical protein Dimus_016002 [Dionaea muscipula]
MGRPMNATTTVILTRRESSYEARDKDCRTGVYLLVSENEARLRDGVRCSSHMPVKKKKKKPKWDCDGVISGLGSDTEQFTFLQPPEPLDEKPKMSLEEGGCSSPVVDSSSDKAMEEDDENLELDLEFPPSSYPVRRLRENFEKRHRPCNV